MQDYKVCSVEYESYLDTSVLPPVVKDRPAVHEGNVQVYMWNRLHREGKAAKPIMGNLCEKHAKELGGWALPGNSGQSVSSK